MIPKASGKIGYTINDLANLMNLAVTKENVVFRKNIDTAWEQIKLFFQGDDDFFACTSLRKQGKAICQQYPRLHESGSDRAR
ncbi:MAG: hypothetical protein LKE52_04410 [Bacilli bacterium]|nr:hypothetical protein [Bacilli bacterium]